MLNKRAEWSVRSDRRSFLGMSIASVIGAGFGGLLGPRRASAQPAPQATDGEVEPFSFCVVADPHCASKVESTRSQGIEGLGNGVDKFLRCAREMAKLDGEDKPDFMLVVGDVHLWALRGRLDEVGVPMHVIAGNHEYGDRKKEMRDLFPADFKKDGRESDYYSFVHKGVRFIGVCDAGKGGEHVGQLCSEDFGPRGQCEWLEAELARPERQKIIFAHIPPHPKGRDSKMHMSRNDSRYFNALIERTQPTAMFFGHLHRATSEHKIGRTRSIVLRSCCWNGHRAALGFMHVRVTGDGIVTRQIDTGQYATQHS